jgi:hypothetical protein
MRKELGLMAKVGFVALLIVLLNGRPALGQDQKLDVMEIARETQKFSTEGGELNIVWWLPQEFWSTSIAANTDVNPAQIQMFTKFVYPYLIVGIVSGKISTFGPPTYRTESEIRSLLTLRDSDGTTYAPIEPNHLAASVPALESLMRPSMAKMLGPLGENMSFFVFPGSRRNGTEVCDASRRGVCEVELGDHEFKWKLPLESVLPKQKCPVCGEILSGGYKYCPYDGTGLSKNK